MATAVVVHIRNHIAHVVSIHQKKDCRRRRRRLHDESYMHDAIRIALTKLAVTDTKASKTDYVYHYNYGSPETDGRGQSPRGGWGVRVQRWG
jgi:hypothetical protein